MIKRGAGGEDKREDESESAVQRQRPNRQRSYWLGDSLDLTPAEPSPPPPQRPVVHQPGAEAGAAGARAGAGPLQRSSFFPSPPNNLQLSFEVSAETAGLAHEIQQQARGDILSGFKCNYEYFFPLQCE